MSTYVLVHGAWHTGKELEPTAAPIRAAGHQVHTPTIAGNRPGDSKKTGLDEAINSIVDYLASNNLRDVVLMGHSYGGMIITGVADRAADRVGRVVYLDAATPVDGQSLVDVAGPIIEAVRPYGQTIDGVELVLLPGPGAGALYGVTDPGDLAWMDERLTGHPWKCFEQPLKLTNEAAFNALPKYHIVCTSTLATRDEDLMREAREAGRLWDIDTGHDLMITEPRAVTDALIQVASA